MNEEMRQFVKELHDEGCRGCIHMKIGRCGHIMMGLFCGNKLHTAANTIESLSAQLEQVTRERDAAVEDVKSLCGTNYFSGNFCEYCKHNEPDGQCHQHCIPYSSEWGWQWRGVEVE